VLKDKPPASEKLFTNQFVPPCKGKLPAGAKTYC
jgi:hypothetical protein